MLLDSGTEAAGLPEPELNVLLALELDEPFELELDKLLELELDEPFEFELDKLLELKLDELLELELDESFELELDELLELLSLEIEVITEASDFDSDDELLL